VSKTVYHGGEPIAVEEFFVRRRFRAFSVEELSARQVEAFLILEKELAAEVEMGTRGERS
jgi:hypothetical protein